MGDCIHKWIANSGQGGEPKFSKGNNPYNNTTHVKCSECNARTWLTPEQRYAIYGRKIRRYMRPND